MNPSGTNSVNPPVRFWMVRKRRIWRTQSAGSSTCPYIMVEVVGMPSSCAVEIITTAHELGIPTTSTMMYGHVEEPADWVRHILLLRTIQKRTGGFTEFVPLGFIHENTRLYRHGGARPGAKREEHLRVHALARVLLHGAIKNLQVSWVKLGFEMSLACLRAGANDFSGTLMEESISKAAGATFREYVSPEEFRARIRSIARVPALRTTIYTIRRSFH